MRKSVVQSGIQTEHRRRFLRLLAGSPLLALSGLSLEGLLAAQDGPGNDTLRAFDEIGHLGPLITAPDQALDVFDFVPVARKAISPSHFGFLSGATDDDGTLRADREGFARYQIRPRRLVNVQNIDMSVRLFGAPWSSPIILAPCGAMKAFHPDCEIAVAKAARSKGHLVILSTASNSSIEDVTAAQGGPVWFQLYPTNVWEIARAMVKRAEAAGCPVLVLTVDQAGGSNREDEHRWPRIDSRPCASCHNRTSFATSQQRIAMYKGLDLSKATIQSPPTITWDLVKRLKDTTSMKLVIKGILTREDAQLAVENGVDGVYVSNHGGRSVSSNRSTIEILPEVVEGVAGKVPVLFDSGVRRGTDMFKALAMGASAVGIGRTFLYGLAAFGQPGVEAVLELLRRELHIDMAQAGTTSIDKITRAYLVDRSANG